MFILKPNSKFYVVCPAFNKTGGTELAHQLVHELNSYGDYARVAYYGVSDDKSPINPAFKNYVDRYEKVEDIPDVSENILIVPEIKVNVLERFSKIQKAIWWMSVDNYLKYDGLIHSSQQLGLMSAIKGILTGRIPFRRRKLNNSFSHFYQSEYAHQFLLTQGITNCWELSDYINDVYLERDCYSNLERENNVLYNPRKGIDFTKKIIASAPDIKWIPIENMTTDEVRNLLFRSKVYIDFGNHPGKDRFPREAAISGCCVITGKRGSAKFEEDVPIGNENKFDDTEENIIPIINRIRECLNNYTTEMRKYDKYREFIKSEPSDFKCEVKRLLE